MRERKAYVSENMRRTITLLAVMALMSLLMVLMPMSREEALEAADYDIIINNLSVPTSLNLNETIELESPEITDYTNNSSFSFSEISCAWCYKDTEYGIYPANDTMYTYAGGEEPDIHLEYAYLIGIFLGEQEIGDIKELNISINGKDYVAKYGSSNRGFFTAINLGTLDEEGNFSGGDFDIPSESWSYDARTDTFTVSCTIPAMKEIGEEIPREISILGEADGIKFLCALWGVTEEDGFPYASKKWVNAFENGTTFEAGAEYGYIICIQYYPEIIPDLANTTIVLNGRVYNPVGVSVPASSATGNQCAEIFIACDFGVLSENGKFSGGDFDERTGFDVSFNANGGTGSMSATNVTESTYTLPACGFTAPEGKEFAGWAYAANGDVINSTTIQISTDITLFATWKDVKNDIPSVPIIIIPTPEPTPEVTPEPSEEPVTEEDSETTEDVTPESSTEPDSEETQAPVEDYTVPVESEEESVPVGAKIEDGIATVDEITEDMLENIVSENNTETAETEEEQTEDEQNEDSQTEEETEEEVSKTDSITIDLSRAKQGVNGAEVTKSSVENLLDVVNDDNNSINSVVFKMSGAMVTLDAKTLEAVIEGSDGETVRLVVEKTEEKGLNNSQKKTLENYEVERTFEAYFESNEKRIHDFKGGKALVSLSFKPEKGKRAENYKVYYVDEIGELQKMTTKYEDGLITFVTGHFSDYAIVYENVKEVLIAEPSMTSKGNIKLNWNKITGAVKYMVYGAKCGTSYKLLAELDAETDGNSFVVKQINDAKLISGKTYKFVVVAYDALGNKFRSKSVHFIAGNTSEKYGNVETITALQKTVELTVGEKATVGAEYTVYENKLHTPEKHGKALRFTSDCPDVVKVAKDGTITAKSEGKAIIYVQDISGKWCTVEVTVKAK